MSSNSPLPSSAPQIVSVNPATVEIGSTDDVVITGLNTNFVQDQTQVTFPQGVTVSTILVLVPTVLIATITVAVDAPTGTFPITVTTGSETETLASGITIAAQGTITPVPVRQRPPAELDFTIYLGLIAECIPEQQPGSGFQLDWTVYGVLSLDPTPAWTPANPQFTTSLQPPGTMQVKVNKWAMEAPDGTEVVLTSPMTYLIQVNPTLNLGVPNPVLTL